MSVAFLVFIERNKDGGCEVEVSAAGEIFVLREPTTREGRRFYLSFEQYREAAAGSFCD